MQNNENQKTYFIYVRSTGEKVPVTKAQHDSFYKEADRAWSRESAVFRVTGVLSVIGGWFITAGVAFAVCAIVCMSMYLGGWRSRCS